MPLWDRSGIISSVEGVWLDIPLTRSILISHIFYVTARKIIYAACSIQAGRYFIGQINNAKSTSPAVSSEEERGLLSRTAAGNRAYVPPGLLRLLLGHDLWDRSSWRITSGDYPFAINTTILLFTFVFILSSSVGVRHLWNAEDRGIKEAAILGFHVT